MEILAPQILIHANYRFLAILWIRYLREFPRGSGIMEEQGPVISDPYSFIQGALRQEILLHQPYFIIS